MSLRQITRIPFRAFSSSSVCLSGHSKWSKIAGKKGKADADRAQTISRVNRDIVVAVRSGGSPDPTLNPGLFSVLRKARAAGIPKSNIEDAISKASKPPEKGDQSPVYQALVAGSVGVVIECMTDNVNRTIAQLKGILSTHNARVATVGFMFERKGCVRVSSTSEDMERVIEAALEASADDFEDSEAEDGSLELKLLCPPEAIKKVTDAVCAPNMCKELVSSELIYAPLERLTADEATEEIVENLKDDLEDHSDVLRVWTSIDN